jgi:aspartate oxidase
VSVSADVLIVGSGAAGLTAALNLAETHKVAVIVSAWCWRMRCYKIYRY